MYQATHTLSNPIITHNLGFPRIGKQRALKFALEQYWQGTLSADELAAKAAALRAQHWAQQASLSMVPVGDFSLYDQVLDHSFMFGNIPARVHTQHTSRLEQYFQVARGKSSNHQHDCACIRAGEMTKWFDTNYHYIVPEIDASTAFSLHSDAYIAQVKEALALGYTPKPVLIGPLTYLWLAHAVDGTNRLAKLPSLLLCYEQLLAELSALGVEWVQIDEPILATELESDWHSAFEPTYQRLKAQSVKLLLSCYYGGLAHNLRLATELPVAGLHIDGIRARHEVTQVIDWLPTHKVLSIGVVDGRNIWKNNLSATLDWLEPIASQLQGRLWIAPSCSLLHVPLDVSQEREATFVHTWLSFAVQKIEEIQILGTALHSGRVTVLGQLRQNAQDIHERQSYLATQRSKHTALSDAQLHSMMQRNQPHAQRKQLQQAQLGLPLFPTTTIGSFPQTTHIRQIRKQWKNGTLSNAQYQTHMHAEIAQVVEVQHRLGLDVLVHGEAERNDMVEYFAEHLTGFVVSSDGWVQSYGSRCVKPPIIYADVSRPQPITLPWTTYAQSLTLKPMKGMLTGPVTLLNWSFVRDDQPRQTTCQQIALAIRQEVVDLEKAGIAIIQIDEAALREGLPLRKNAWAEYLTWAVNCFKLSANGVQDSTQIHTHMCYSDFNDIIQSIADMDADVITIETSRSHMALLSAFEQFNYPNHIGPGVYDIHSPNIPSVEGMVELINLASSNLAKQQLWVNPDCGLKTRGWDETISALTNMVTAAKTLRQLHAS